MEIKVIIVDLGIIKIMLKPDSKPVKQRHYHHNPKYKEKVRLDLEKMLMASIIELVDESDWVSPIMVHEKKHKDEIRICVDLKKLIDSSIHDPFPTSFIAEVLDNVGGQEAYSFMDGYH